MRKHRWLLITLLLAFLCAASANAGCLRTRSLVDHGQAHERSKTFKAIHENKAEDNSAKFKRKPRGVEIGVPQISLPCLKQFVRFSPYVGFWHETRFADLLYCADQKRGPPPCR